MAASPAQVVVDPALFEQLQTKIDEDAELRQAMRGILQTWEKQRQKIPSDLERTPY